MSRLLNTAETMQELFTQLVHCARQVGATGLGTGVGLTRGVGLVLTIGEADGDGDEEAADVDALGTPLVRSGVAVVGIEVGVEAGVKVGVDLVV